MGILDKKTRFIDLVVTQEGKRQIAAGQLRAEFASLSDCNTYYKKGEEDTVSQRIYFEVMERPENAIVLEKDDSGQIINLNMSPTGSIVGNAIFSQASGSSVLDPLTGSDFTIGMNSVLDSSIRHFQKNYFTGTEEVVGDNEFELDKTSLEFTITNTQPFNGSPYREVINVNDAEPFFLDAKLAHLPNFQYLPPVSHRTGREIGQYTDIRSTSRETWEDISTRIGEREYNKKELIARKNSLNLKQHKEGTRGYLSQKLLKNGKLPVVIENFGKEVKTLSFLKTSEKNNLLIQVYEDAIGPEMNKLDVIDAGTFLVDNDPNKRHEKRVFYVGKVYYDDLKMPTFINIFTIIMD